MRLTLEKADGPSPASRQWSSTIAATKPPISADEMG